jgi:hypothetical protein
MLPQAPIVVLGVTLTAEEHQVFLRERLACLELHASRDWILKPKTAAERISYQCECVSARRDRDGSLKLVFVATCDHLIAPTTRKVRLIKRHPLRLVKG